MGAADHHITSGIDGAGETGGAVAALAGTPRARPRVDWSNLSPLRLFFGPVFQREVRSTGRRRWTYVLRMIFPLGMLGIVTLAYMGMTQSLDHVGSSGVGGAARLQLLQRLAPQLATVIAWCQFAALTFLGPVLTGPCICDEKRNRTLSALMTTPMTSAQIILGMLTSRLVHVFIITLAAAPLLLAIRIFGGLEASIILSFTGIVLSAGLAGATIGLFFSIGSRTATSAATGAVLVLILQTAAPLAVLAYYAVHYNVPPPGWVYAVSPAMSMFGVTAGLFDGGGGPGAMGYQTLALLSTAINLTLATITVLISIVALRRVMLAQAAGEGATREVRRGWRQLRRQAKAANRSRSAPPTTAPSSSALESVLEAAPEPSADAPSEPAPAEHQGARPRTSRVVSDAPVLWREFRQASFGSRRNLIILLIALAIGLFFLYRNAAIDDHAVHLIIGVVTLLMIGLHSAVVPSGAIAGERDARTLEALLTTLLTPAEIIRGKLLGILRRQWLAFAILAAHFSYATIAGITRPITIAHVLLIAAYTSVFLHSTCMFWSLLFKRATTAAAANVLLALSLWMGAPILTALLMEAFGYYGPPNDVFTNGVFTLNPMVMLVSSIEGGMSTPSYGGQSGSYSLPGYSVGLWGFNARVAVNGALYVGAALLALLATRRLFTRLARR